MVDGAVQREDTSVWYETPGGFQPDSGVVILSVGSWEALDRLVLTYSPHMDAGILMLPPWSQPMLMSASPLATTLPLPELLPPHE